MYTIQVLLSTFSCLLLENVGDYWVRPRTKDLQRVCRQLSCMHVMVTEEIRLENGKNHAQQCEKHGTGASKMPRSCSSALRSQPS